MTGRWAWLGGGYPELCTDVLRNLARAARALTGAGDAVVTFDRDPAAMAAHWYEITAARAARNLAASPPRPVGLTAWRRAWGQASELATLRAGGELAAWLLADPQPSGYLVLAGQMTARHRHLRPGYALEALVVARALAGPEPWPALPDPIEAVLKAVQVRQLGGRYGAHAWLDWGPGHPGTLLTRSRHAPGERS